jgi:hypothetical protein
MSLVGAGEKIGQMLPHGVHYRAKFLYDELYLEVVLIRHHLQVQDAYAMNFQHLLTDHQCQVECVCADGDLCDYGDDDDDVLNFLADILLTVCLYLAPASPQYWLWKWMMTLLDLKDFLLFHH